MAYWGAWRTHGWIYCGKSSLVHRSCVTASCTVEWLVTSPHSKSFFYPPFGWVQRWWRRWSKGLFHYNPVIFCPLPLLLDSMYSCILDGALCVRYSITPISKFLWSYPLKRVPPDVAVQWHAHLALPLLDGASTVNDAMWIHIRLLGVLLKDTEGKRVLGSVSNFFFWRRVDLSLPMLANAFVSTATA